VLASDIGDRRNLLVDIVLVQREMEFGLGSLAGNDGTTGFALGGRC
jgi:hypothetical protein